MNIEIWSIGKQNDPFIEEGIQSYFKKIRPFASVKLDIITPKKSFGDILSAKKYEEELILKKYNGQDFFIVLDERGKKLNSVQWAEELQKNKDRGVRNLVFLIGGAYGVTDPVIQKANAVWSLSDLVFPHQLVRLILAEQIYRSFSILHHLPYHHI